MKNILEVISCKYFVVAIRFLWTKFFSFPYQKLWPVYKGEWQLRGECAECQHVTKTLKIVGTYTLMIMVQLNRQHDVPLQ